MTDYLRALQNVAGLPDDVLEDLAKGEDLIAEAARDVRCERARKDLVPTEVPKASSDALENVAVAMEELAAMTRAAPPLAEGHWIACLFTAREAARIFARLAGVPYDENQPTDEEADREMERLNGTHASDCGIWLEDDRDDAACDCRPDDEPAEPDSLDEPGDIDGDDGSALASAGMGTDEDYE